MNRFKCPACGGNQYTACGKAEGCIVETIRKRAVKEKPDFIDALLAEVEK